MSENTWKEKLETAKEILRQRRKALSLAEDVQYTRLNAELSDLRDSVKAAERVVDAIEELHK